MATGTVSSVSGDVWQTIATTASTSGTSVTFSSLAGYKKFLLTWQNVGTNSSLTHIKLQFNSDTTSGNYVGNLIGSTPESRVNFIPLHTNNQASGITGFMYIDNALGASPKPVNGTTSEGGGGYPTEVIGMWFGTGAITTIAATLVSSSFSAGTFTLYGIAA